MGLVGFLWGLSIRLGREPAYREGGIYPTITTMTQPPSRQLRNARSLSAWGLNLLAENPKCLIKTFVSPPRI